MQPYDPGLLTDWCLSVPRLLLVPLLNCLALRKSSEALAMVISMHVCIGHCPPSGRRGDRAAAMCTLPLCFLQKWGSRVPVALHRRAC